MSKAMVGVKTSLCADKKQLGISTTWSAVYIELTVVSAMERMSRKKKPVDSVVGNARRTKQTWETRPYQHQPSVTCEWCSIPKLKNPGYEHVVTHSNRSGHGSPTDGLQNPSLWRIGQQQLPQAQCNRQPGSLQLRQPGGEEQLHDLTQRQTSGEFSMNHLGNKSAIPGAWPDHVSNVVNMTLTLTDGQRRVPFWPYQIGRSHALAKMHLQNFNPLCSFFGIHANLAKRFLIFRVNQCLSMGQWEDLREHPPAAALGHFVGELDQSPPMSQQLSFCGGSPLVEWFIAAKSWNLLKGLVNTRCKMRSIQNIFCIKEIIDCRPIWLLQSDSSNSPCPAKGCAAAWQMPRTGLWEVFRTGSLCTPHMHPHSTCVCVCVYIQ